jgi:hypothetical protein
MNDSEMIEALENLKCTTHLTPYDNTVLPFCVSVHDVLGIIYRLREANRMLREEIGEQDEAITNALRYLGELRRTVRADTVKEFARLLKPALHNCFDDMVDCIAEEMVGDEDGE